MEEHCGTNPRRLESKRSVSQSQQLEPRPTTKGITGSPKGRLQCHARRRPRVVERDLVGGQAIGGDRNSSSISGDGRWVAFSSTAISYGIGDY